MCQSQTSNLSLPSPLPPSNHKFIFYVCNSVSVFELIYKAYPFLKIDFI